MFPEIQDIVLLVYVWSIPTIVTRPLSPGGKLAWTTNTTKDMSK
jgi:hypothetical protein